MLTVTRPEAKPKIGSVGQALPGVDVRILNPNEQGIGEVIARGPNVMAGYYENKEATDVSDPRRMAVHRRPRLPG